MVDEAAIIHLYLLSKQTWLFIFLVQSGEKAPQHTIINWYYYGVPIIVLVLLIMVGGWVYYQNKRNSSHHGTYDFKFAERDEVIVD